MTQLAPCNSVEAITAGGGLLPRLRAWFARSATAYTAALRDHDASERVTAGGDDSNNDFNPAVAAAHDVEPVAPPCSERQTAILLPFPIRGEALLVKLADQLRDRIASSVTKRDSFILTMSRCSYSRLIIDGAAHIEFLADTAIYRPCHRRRARHPDYCRDVRFRHGGEVCCAIRRRSPLRRDGRGDCVVSVNKPSSQVASGDPSLRGERRSYLRYGAALAVVAVLLGTGIYFLVGHDDMPPPRQVRELTIVNIVPPPPPPPPQKMLEQKMIEQPKMAEQEFKEDKPLEKPKDEPVKDAKNNEPPGPLSLDAKATGPGDLFNLGGKLGGNPYGGGGGGSRFGWYASIVQSQIEAALRGNARTRNSVMQIRVRLWADGSGRISRVELSSSTGDAELDAIIRNQVLGSLMLREPPPKDMPMPMITRVTARRPI